MKQTDWINVKDKLPTIGKRVLVCQTFNDGEMFVRMATLVKINGNYRHYIIALKNFSESERV